MLHPSCTPRRANALLHSGRMHQHTVHIQQHELGDTSGLSTYVLSPGTSSLSSQGSPPSLLWTIPPHTSTSRCSDTSDFSQQLLGSFPRFSTAELACSHPSGMLRPASTSAGSATSEWSGDPICPPVHARPAHPQNLARVHSPRCDAGRRGRGASCPSRPLHPLPDRVLRVGRIPQQESLAVAVNVESRLVSVLTSSSSVSLSHGC